MTAETASIHPALAEALAQKGYETLTPVQSAVLTQGGADADLLVSAQTGSGKTVAFGLAIAGTLLGGEARFGRAGAPLALVIAPTRELALQVKRELTWLYDGAGAWLASCVGGMDLRTERRTLERGCHIVVGTPGRLRDHISKGALDLSNVRAIVLDEADEMLDLGFREDLEFILGSAPEDRRTLMFSATVPAGIARLAKTFQRDAQRIVATAERERHADIDYQMMLVNRNEQENAIINTLLWFDQSNTIVFCQTREAVKHLSARLANRGFAVVAMSGELSQAERNNALHAMRNGRARVCVATDVAARGIDLPNLDLVIHADLPTNAETLLHRSGRTGRAGRKGVCALIVPVNRRAGAQRLLKAANIDATYRSAPTADEIEEQANQRVLEGALVQLPAEDTEHEMVARLVDGVPHAQLALAYLRSLKAARPAPEEVGEASFDKGKPTRERSGSGNFTDGAWFSLSIGRKQRADPKWLLPIICKAGGITKREVGSIRIEDNETHFEIMGEAAADFAVKAKKAKNLESGVRITALEGMPEGSRRSAPRFEGKPKKRYGASKRAKGPQGPRD